MSITFECMACGADYDHEIPVIVERPSVLKCPNCGSHPPAHRAHALSTALEDLLAAMAAVRKKIRFEVSLETDELPPPYGPADDEEQGLDFEGEEGEEDEEDEEEGEETAAAPVAARGRAAKAPAVARVAGPPVKKDEEEEDDDEEDDDDLLDDDDDDLADVDDDDEDDDDDDFEEEEEDEED